MRSRLLTIPCAALLALAPAEARAFCGFYVAGAEAKLVNSATQVVLMREGVRTVLSMQNNYQGPPEDFALVVPVPVVLQKENVKTLPRDLFARVDRVTAPRLVEYWEQDPCDPSSGRSRDAARGFGAAPATDPMGSGRSAEAVRVEAEFTVGEYEVVVLSAGDSSALDRWLRQNGYRIPDGAEPLLRPYVAAGQKFFVARVDAAKVRFDHGMATLSPLRFHYDSDAFSLPVRLGLLNSSGAQDLIVTIVARGQRYEASNYPNVTIPTNLDVADKARDDFGAFYAALFDEAAQKAPRAVVTEYAWDARSCDPCPVPALTATELMTLGADVLPPGDGSSRRPDAGAPTRPRAAIVEGAMRERGGRSEWTAGPNAILKNRIGTCYQQLLRSKPTLGGEIKLTVTLSPVGAVKEVRLDRKGAISTEIAACADGAVRAMTFPVLDPSLSSFEASYTLSSREPAGAPPLLLSGAVLSRLHVRYDSRSLGEDLLFRAAPPIAGGREIRGPKSELETEARPAVVNTFQARYAIRHRWEGAAACAEPRRGLWGGPPKGASAAGAPKPAVDLAFARREGVGLSAFLTPPLALPPPPDAAPQMAKRGAGCGGCEAAGRGDGRGGAWVAALLALVGVGGRRRRVPRGRR